VRSLLPLLGTLLFMGSFACADLGTQIAADDAALGSNPGEIHVTSSGTISEGRVSLSAGHDLVCSDQTTISLNAGSYIYQNSHTTIRNCIISGTSTPIDGGIQSVNTNHVELDNVTFIGGGNLVFWNGVTDFVISDNTVESITGVNLTTNTAMSGMFLVNCARGQVNNLKVNSFVFPAGANSTGVLGINLCDDVTINNPVAQNVDASFVQFGASPIVIAGSTNVSVNGGTITGNANMDGILIQSYGDTPSSHITITGLNSSFNGAAGLNAVPGALGDGIDLINTSHVLISHCTLNGNGSPLNKQPGIWIFIDDDVVVADTDISNGSIAGIATAGSPNVVLLRDTINNNQASGVFTEWQGGTATNVGPAVTFVAGVSGGFGLAWAPGTQLGLDGINYPLASVTDSTHLILAVSPPDHSAPVTWGVETTQEIRDSVINDNGLGRAGGQEQVGISWANGTSGTISGVTAIDTGAGTQLFGLELENTATAILSGNNFSVNAQGVGGIQASSQDVSTSSLSFANQQIATTSPAQTVTLTAGAIVIPDLQIQSNGDFSQTNNCGTSLSAFGTCQIQVTLIPKTAGVLSGTITITDGAPGSPKTVSLGGTGVTAGLGLSIATGGSNVATVAAGQTAEYLLSIGGAGVSGTASLSCKGAPPGASCTVPASQNIDAAQPTAFTASVTTLAPVAAAFRPRLGSPGIWSWALLMFGWVIVPVRASFKRVTRGYSLSIALVFLLFLCSCGGSDKPRFTPPGSYTLTVTANMGSTSIQMPLTLVVQ
jgi:hypothetical protein